MAGIGKRNLFLLAVAAAVMLAGILAAAQLRPAAHAQTVRAPRPARCSAASLNGTYMWSAHGEVPLTPGTRGSFAVSGIQTFDGRGRGRGFYSQSMNGRISRRVSFTSAYILNPNCAGTYTATDATRTVRHSDVYTLPSGRQVAFIATDPGVVLSGVAEAK